MDSVHVNSEYPHQNQPMDVDAANLQFGLKQRYNEFENIE